MPISAVQWKRIFDGYVKTSTVHGAAQYAGVRDVTAAKYIKLGDPARGLDSIEKTLREQNKILVDEYQRVRQRELEGYRSLASMQLSRVARALSMADIELKGKTSGDGKIELSVKDYMQLHRIARSNFDFACDVHDEIHGGRKNADGDDRTINVGVNVNVADPHKRNIMEWRAIEQRFLNNDEANKGAVERARILAQKTAVGSVPAGDGEEEPLPETTDPIRLARTHRRNARRAGNRSAPE